MVNALPDTAVTTAGTPVTINVLANDTGTGIVITSFSNPANGNLVFNGDKSFTYTPAAGFLGEDTFSYTVRDAQGTPATAEVTVSVVANDGATVATDDFVEVVAGGGVVVPALANDMAAGGGELQIIAVSVPGHGVVNVLPDQSIRYVPQTGFVGIDSFTYTVLDEQGSTASATVTVKVVAANSAPLAMNDNFSVVAGEPAVLAVLANDSDPDGGPLQIVGFTMPSHGSLVFDSTNKTFSYTSDAGYEGTDQFTYTIRDNRGASASATVTLNVVQVSEVPEAVDDHVTTEAGVPVTIDVLANDELPEGQQIAIVAVTLPFKGKLDFNPDKTLTYTPNAGFVGTDDFTYTIGNGKGGTAKANVTIEVTPASTVATYANGYRYRRRIVMPATMAQGETLVGFPLWVELAGNWLKTAGNGGKLANASGYDLRFERADGSKLAHEIERYDAEIGSLGAWVRLPELSNDQPTVVLVYYGKPDLTASEAEPETVWQDYLAVWHLPDSLDASAEGRVLAPAGSLASTADGLGAGALLLGGNGVLSIADTSWLDGRDALSIQLRSKAGSIGHDRGQLNVGGFGSDAASNLALRYQATGFAGNQPANVIHSKLKTTAGNVGASSAAGTQSTAWQSLAFQWATGDSGLDLYVDGRPTPLSYANQIDGPATTQISGPLHLGAGPRDTADGGWVGLIDEVRFRPAKLDEAWLAAEHANQTDPAGFFGIGAEETVADATPGIVAIPLEVETSAGQWVDIDVLAAALSAGTDTPTIQVATQPQKGTASVIGGKVRYTPTSGTLGTDKFTYRLTADGQSATAQISVLVTSSVSQGQQGGADELLQPLRIVSVKNQSELNAAKAAARPGDHLLLANGSYSLGNVTVSGTLEAPIVFRAENNQAVTLTGLGDVSADNVRFWGFNCGNDNFGLLTGRNIWIIRCRWSGTSTGNRIRFRSPGGRVWHCRMTGNGRMIAFDTGANAGGSGLMGIQGHVRGCWFHDVAPGGNNATEVITVGFADTRTLVQSDTLIEYCLFEDCNLGGQEDETIAIKSSYVTVRNCTFRRTRFLAVRHGTHAVIDGCVHIDSSAGGFKLRDADGILQNSKTIGQSRTAIFAGNVLSTAAGGGDWWTTPTSSLNPGVKFPAAFRTKVYNHEAVDRAPVIGDKYSADFDPLRPADQVVWLGNRGIDPAPRTSPSGYWSDLTPANQWGDPAPVDYVAPLTLTSGQVGPTVGL